MRNSWLCKHKDPRWGTSVATSAYEGSLVAKEAVKGDSSCVGCRKIQ